MNPPANVGDTGLIPAPGSLHMLWGNWPGVPQLPSLYSRAHEPQLDKSPSNTVKGPTCCNWDLMQPKLNTYLKNSMWPCWTVSTMSEGSLSSLLYTWQVFNDYLLNWWRGLISVGKPAAVEVGIENITNILRCSWWGKLLCWVVGGVEGALNIPSHSL